MNRYQSIFALSLALSTGCYQIDNPTGRPSSKVTAEKSAAPAVTRELIVGTWRDVGTKTVESYSESGTVVSHLNETISIQLNEGGFIGTASVPLVAKTSGSWTFSRGELSVTIEEIYDLTLGEVDVKADSNPFGDDFISELAVDLQHQLQEDLPQQIAGQTMILSVLTITDEKLVTRDEDGIIEEQIRVADTKSNGG